jgi:hypothetical protein
MYFAPSPHIFCMHAVATPFCCLCGTSHFSAAGGSWRSPRPSFGSRRLYFSIHTSRSPSPPSHCPPLLPNQQSSPLCPAPLRPLSKVYSAISLTWSSVPSRLQRPLQTPRFVHNYLMTRNITHTSGPTSSGKVSSFSGRIFRLS